MNHHQRHPLIGITAHHYAFKFGIEIIAQGQMSSYIKAIASTGGAPVLLPLDLDEGPLRVIFEQLDGLVLPGGPDSVPAHYGQEPHEKLGRVDEELDRTELILTRWALDADLPLLAICRGIQVLNIALGGTLYQDVPSQLPNALEHHRFRQRGYPPNDQAHKVTVTAGSRLAAALGDTKVMANSRHHQAIDTPALGLSVVANTADGLIEGVELPQASFALGVQWHPENLIDENPPMRRLFESFIRAARD